MTVNIDGVEIEWSFVSLVRKKLGGDWERVMDAFWRARRMPTAQDMMKYVMAGFKRRPHPLREPSPAGEGGHAKPHARSLGMSIPWNFTPSATWQNPGGKETIERWWRKCAGTNYREFDIATIYTPKDINEVLRAKSLEGR